MGLPLGAGLQDSWTAGVWRQLDCGTAGSGRHYRLLSPNNCPHKFRGMCTSLRCSLNSIDLPLEDEFTICDELKLHVCPMHINYIANPVIRLPGEVLPNVARNPLIGQVFRTMMLPDLKARHLETLP